MGVLSIIFKIIVLALILFLFVVACILDFITRTNTAETEIILNNAIRYLLNGDIQSGYGAIQSGIKLNGGKLDDDVVEQLRENNIYIFLSLIDDKENREKQIKQIIK